MLVLSVSGDMPDTPHSYSPPPSADSGACAPIGVVSVVSGIKHRHSRGRSITNSAEMMRPSSAKAKLDYTSGMDVGGASSRSMSPIGPSVREPQVSIDAHTHTQTHTHTHTHTHNTYIHTHITLTHTHTHTAISHRTSTDQSQGTCGGRVLTYQTSLYHCPVLAHRTHSHSGCVWENSFK